MTKIRHPRKVKKNEIAKIEINFKKCISLKKKCIVEKNKLFGLIYDYNIYHSQLYDLISESKADNDTISIKIIGDNCDEKIYDMFLSDKKMKTEKCNKKLSSGEEAVSNALNKLKKIYKLYYLSDYVWSFCKNINTLRYDFYCIILLDDHIIQFVIEYDGAHHYAKMNNDSSGTKTYYSKDFDCDDSHIRDILKQYYMAQMCIHILRLSSTKNMLKTILKFIETIIDTTKYVIWNPIKPRKKIFLNDESHNGLIFFHDIYKNRFLRFNKMHELSASVLCCPNIDARIASIFGQDLNQNNLEY